MTLATHDRFKIIVKLFEDEKFQAEKIQDDWHQYVLIFRGAVPFQNRFVTLTHFDDFRDGFWSITISPGFGYPEKADDPVEFYFASISTLDLGIVEQGTQRLPYEIEGKEVLRLLYSSVAYSLAYLNGAETTVIDQIRERNRKKLNKPLISIGSPEYDHRRNREIKDMLRKYL